MASAPPATRRAPVIHRNPAAAHGPTASTPWSDGSARPVDRLHLNEDWGDVIGGVLAEQRAADRHALVHVALHQPLVELARELHAADLVDAVNLVVDIGDVGADGFGEADHVGL